MKTPVRRPLAVLAALTLLGGVAACSSGKPSSPPTAASSSAKPNATIPVPASCKDGAVRKIYTRMGELDLSFEHGFVTVLDPHVPWVDVVTIHGWLTDQRHFVNCDMRTVVNRRTSDKVASETADSLLTNYRRGSAEPPRSLVSKYRFTLDGQTRAVSLSSLAKPGYLIAAAEYSALGYVHVITLIRFDRDHDGQPDPDATALYLEAVSKPGPDARDRYCDYLSYLLITGLKPA